MNGFSSEEGFGVVDMSGQRSRAALVERRREKVEVEVVSIVVGRGEEHVRGTTGSVTLILYKDVKLLIDCGDPWNGPEILANLQKRGVSAEEVTHVAITHGHIDHIGNLHLFPNATFIMSRDRGQRLPNGVPEYNEADQDEDRPLFTIVPELIWMSAFEEIPGAYFLFTTAHSAEDLMFYVNTKDGVLIVAGDLFENEDLGGDVPMPVNPANYNVLREAVLDRADFIVPGHGRIFFK
ncbi:unnamed protein product [Caenorhabditis auriculariae]|uniref:Metallo-beta-lactamase domain-containing protein n=1 Tax=Caenorhabditis auriculariae TaxID=2777116 RepID=A0A8S1GS08_9PELO|nr:unnamed protein product [Caenorhabditis auriculariae]